jgi:hypothetical protein
MKTVLFLFAWLLLQAPARAQPMYEQSHSGHMVWHNQVEYHTIQVYNSTGHLRIWTDSNAGGAGFNPVLTLWRKGVRLAMNDDHTQYFNYYQGTLDAGIELFGLEDGTYVATTASPNFPLGNRLSAGFAYDLQAPIPMATWCPPGSPGTACPKDRHFSLHWTVQ